MRVIIMPVHLVTRLINLDWTAAHAEPHTERVVGGEERSKQRDPTEKREGRILAGESLRDDRILREESGGEGESRQTQAADEESPTDDAEPLHLAEARHLAKIKLAGHAVHNCAAAKEEQRLEECMGEDVIHRAEAGADAEA